MGKAKTSVIDIFRRAGGILTYLEAENFGIHPETLSRMTKRGELIKLSRGLYALDESQYIGNPDLLIVAKKIKRAVICLTSALSFHQIGTQIPKSVEIALPTNAEMPILDFPPITIYWFGRDSYNAGKEEIKVDNIEVSVYSIEKTIADCFKYRNKIGIDVGIEALKEAHSAKKINIGKLLEFSKINRITKTIFPYLEILN